MSTATPIEMEARLHRLERQNRFLIFLLVGFAAVGSIAATNQSEIRTSHLIIVDNHGKMLSETEGINGQIRVRRYAEEVTTNY